MTETIVGVRIELQYYAPKIWRRIQVPTYISLTTLHEIIQVAFDWDNDHLSGFYVGRDFCASPHWGYEQEEEFSSDDFSLVDVINARFKRYGFKYIYDFGDSWTHIITIGKPRQIKQPMTCPILLGGARCAPIEDYGVFTYDDYVEILGDRDPTVFSEDDFVDGDPVTWLMAQQFDPENFDEVDLQAKLNEISLMEPYPMDRKDWKYRKQFLKTLANANPKFD